jgi:uncharacterized protein (DUF1778 family)
MKALPKKQVHNFIKLTKRDSEVFVDALLNPPELNKNLKAAAKKYFKLVSSKTDRKESKRRPHTQ